MVKKTGILILFFTIILLNMGFSQDPHFSQFYANPLFLNPAMAGSAICPRIIMNFRNQWPQITGTYVTYNASYDEYVNAISGGIGILANVDRAGEGTINTTTLSGIYSYNLEVSASFSVKAGLQVTYFQRSLDWDKLTFPDQLDPKDGFVYNTNETMPDDLRVSFADFSTGIVGYSEKFFGGFAVHHLTRPDEGFKSHSRIPIKYTVHVGGIFPIEDRFRSRRSNEPVSLSPNILYMQQQKFQQLNYGMYLHRFPFVGGLWFRQNFNNPDALVLLVGVQQNMFKFGYSYDLTVSKLTNASGGAHEFSLTYMFECRTRTKKIKPINCPSF